MCNLVEFKDWINWFILKNKNFIKLLQNFVKLLVLRYINKIFSWVIQSSNQ